MKEMDVEFLLLCHNYNARPERAALDTVHRILKTDQLSISCWVSSSFTRCWASIIRLWHTAKINLLQAFFVACVKGHVCPSSDNTKILIG